MLYLVFQTLWNRYALHLRGFDQMPTLPRKLTRSFASVGSFFQGILSRVGLGGKGGGGLNTHSHQWAEAGLGGSRYGSGARSAEEEEGMLSAVEEEGEEEEKGPYIKRRTATGPEMMPRSPCGQANYDEWVVSK